MVKYYVSICIYMMGFMTLSVFAEDYMQVDFDSELVGAGPAGWVQESGSWQGEDVFDNKVYKQVGATNSGAHSRYDLSTAQSDLAIDFTFNINQSSTSGYAVWLAVRWTDNDNFVQVGYNAGAWKIRQKIAGVFSEKASLTEVTDGWQYVRVIAQGEVVALYVDQELKILASDITHTSAGNIALYSHYTETYFDNLHAYTLIHADYFDDDTVSSNPSGWAEEVGNWQVSSISSNHVYHKVAAEAGAYSSYDVNEDGLTIEGRFQVVSTAANSAVWYAFRWSDNNNYIQAGHYDGQWIIRQRVSGVWTTLDSFSESLSSGWHDVKITAREQYIVLTVDGETKATSRAATRLAAGKVALYAHNAEVYFDDLTVYNHDEMDFMSRIQAPSLSDKTAQDLYKIWGSSVIKDDAGTFHYFGNRWVRGEQWYFTNRVVHGTSSNLSGSYTIPAPTDLTPDPDPGEITSLKTQTWADKMTSNPFITKIGSTYYLYYIGTTFPDVDPTQTDAVNSQQIGIASSSSLYGPWTPDPGNPILSPRDGYWDDLRVVNPTVYRLPNGKIRLLYKAGGFNLGIAESDNPNGPWDRPDEANFPVSAEDPNVFRERGKYFMLAKAFSGQPVPNHDGIMYESYNGIDWELSPYFHAYEGDLNWTDDSPDEGNINHCKVERVFVYTDAGVAQGVSHAMQETCVYDDDLEAFNLIRTLSN
jgi:hypothetical protein